MNWFIFLKNIIGDDMKKLVLILVCLLLFGCDKNIEQASINIDRDMHGYYGYLIIPEVKIKLGFYNLDSKENNVNKNWTKSDKKYFKKVLDKRNLMRYYIKADSHRELTKI